MSTPRSAAVAVVAATLMLGTACSGGGADMEKDVLRVAFPYPINTMDPTAALGQAQSLPHIHIFETLTQISDDGLSVEPGLAESWIASKDKLSWDFVLQKDVAFTDGSTLDAKAVKTSFDRVLDEDNVVPDRDLIQDISKVEVVNASTVRIYTEAPNAAVPYAVSTPITGIISPESISKWGSDLGEKLPAGTGPFVVADKDFPDSVTLKRNDDYWGSSAPTLKRIVFKAIPDTSARLNALLSGEVDVDLYVDARDKQRLEGRGGYTAIPVTSTRLYMAHFPLGLPVMQDIRVRRAFNVAVDRKQIVETVYDGAAEPAQTAIGSGQSGSEPIHPIPYDPEAAEKLLAEAGWTKGDDGILKNSSGQPFPTITYVSSDGQYPLDAELAQATSGYLKELGVPVNLRTEGDFATFFDSITTMSFEKNWLSQMPWTSYDGNGGESLCKTYIAGNENNLGHYRNQKVESLCKRIDGDFDTESRAQLISDGVELVYADLPALYLVAPAYVVGADSRLEGADYVGRELHDFSMARFEE